jgi:hypothetical protein
MKSNLSNLPKKKQDLNINDFRLDKDTSDKLPFDLLSLLFKDSSHDLASKIIGMCRNKDVRVVDIVASLPLNYMAETPDEIQCFREIYQSRSLLKKYPFSGDRQECRSNARLRFYQSEKWCALTNKRFTAYRKGHRQYPDYAIDLMHETRSIIAKVLGDFDLLRALQQASHGTGSINDPNSDRRSFETTTFFKLHDKLTCTPNAIDYVCDMIVLNEGYSRLLRASEVYGVDSLAIRNLRAMRNTVGIEGNRVSFVPKDRSTDRAIAIEPSGNMMLQIGCGVYIKQCLLKNKVDLYHQEKNQEFARLGSLGLGGRYGPFATIDLKMASDTVSFETVKTLLPTDWFNYLNSIRSPKGTMGKGGDLFDYHKFSSMGNACTFELESLIFYAISLACMKLEGFDGRAEDYLTVYGDDLAFPGQFVPNVIRGLRFFGFRVNKDKSFSEGNFRESCGRDFVKGVDVRPFFLRRRVSTVYDLNFVANSLKMKVNDNGSSCYENLHVYICKLIPRSLTLPIPCISRTRIKYGHSDTEYVSELEGGLQMGLQEARKYDSVKWVKRYQCFSAMRMIVRSRSVTNRYGSTARSEASRYAIFLLGHRGGDITWRSSIYRQQKTLIYSNWV